MKKWLVQIILFVVIIVISGALFLLLYKSPEEKLRLKFLAQCEQGQLDTKTYITALKTGNVTLCSTITDANTTQFCRAEVLQDKNECALIQNPARAEYCTTIVTKNKENCKENPECLALTTGNAAQCEKLDAMNANECKAGVLRDENVLKNYCADASYLLLGKLNKKYCEKITEPVIKAEC